MGGKSEAVWYFSFVIREDELRLTASCFDSVYCFLDLVEEDWALLTRPVALRFNTTRKGLYLRLEEGVCLWYRGSNILTSIKLPAGVSSKVCFVSL